MSYLQHNAGVYKKRTHETHASHLQQLKQPSRKARVVLLGSSHFERLSWFDKAVAAAVPDDVFIAGVGGDKVLNMLYRCESSSGLVHALLLRSPQPEKVIVMAGSNDMMPPRDDSKEAEISARVRRSPGEIAEAVRSTVASVKLLVSFLLSALSASTVELWAIPSDKDHLPEIATYNEALRQWCSNTKSSRLVFSDALFKKTQTAPRSFYKDGVHLSVQGYKQAMLPCLLSSLALSSHTSPQSASTASSTVAVAAPTGAASSNSAAGSAPRPVSAAPLSRSSRRRQNRKHKGTIHTETPASTTSAAAEIKEEPTHLMQTPEAHVTAGHGGKAAPSGKRGPNMRWSDRKRGQSAGTAVPTARPVGHGHADPPSSSPWRKYVVNCRSALKDGTAEDANFVYVGRRNPKIDPQRIQTYDFVFGNPFKVSAERNSRNLRIAEFREHLLSKPALVAQAKAHLKGKILGCWCSPLACHAEVLAEVANS